MKGADFFDGLLGDSRLPMQEDEKPVEIKGYLQEALLKAGMHGINMCTCTARLQTSPGCNMLQL